MDASALSSLLWFIGIGAWSISSCARVAAGMGTGTGTVVMGAIRGLGTRGMVWAPTRQPPRPLLVLV